MLVAPKFVTPDQTSSLLSRPVYLPVCMTSYLDV